MLKDLILKYTLKNAVSYGGKANAGAVLGKVLAEKPELRNQLEKLKKEVEDICAIVNRMSLAEQEAKLLKLAPELLEEKKAEVIETLPELPGAEKNKVVMRFEPSPTGALHIGHAITFLLNAEYCRKYNGKLILRIADTNPAEIYEPAYKLITEEAKWLTDWPFTVKYQSDNLNTYYKHAEELLKKGKAYICLCSADAFKKLVDAGKACPHRELSKDVQLKNWNLMQKKFKEGQAVMRIKTDLKHKNPAVREWPAFRIVEAKHPKTAQKFRVWPLMNFAVAIDDALSGITHVIRGKDHVVNTERQLYIFDYFGWKKPNYMHIGRINFKNLRLSASQTAEDITKKKYSGWDDIRLPFIAALRKRGIQAEASARYAVAIGPSKVDKTLSIEEFMQAIYDYNRKIVDDASRYFFIQKPQRIEIANSPKLTALLPLHPTIERGCRTLATQGKFYITKEDAAQIKITKEGQIYRLMHLFNFVKKKGKFEFHSLELKPELKAKLIHWLPADEKHEKQLAKVTVKIPDGKSLKGLAEKAVDKLKINTVIQFERFGFCCKQEDAFWFAHR